MERWIAWRSPATLLGGAFVAGAVLCAQPAYAGDAPIEEAEYDRELTHAGAIMTGFSIGTLAGAGVTFAIAQSGDEHCGLTNCFRTPWADARLVGAAMLVGGAGMGIIAIPCWLAGRSSKPWPRNSSRRMATGAVLTSVGTGSLGVSAMLLAAMADPSFIEGKVEPAQPQLRGLSGSYFIPTIVQGVTGLGMLVTGIALWGSGARTPQDEDIPDWDSVELRVSVGGASLDTRF